MAMTLDSMVKRTSSNPPMMLFYSRPGLGKTTLASEFPNAAFIQTEDGAGDLELTTFKDRPLASYEEVCEAVELLFQDGHDFKTVVIDSLDHLEPLVWDYTCRANKWASIEEPGYGKGYIETDRHWQKLLTGFSALRARGMTVIFLAHEEVKTFNDPMRDSYDRYQIRLHKRARGLFEDTCDVIGFMDSVISTTEEKGGFAKTKKASGSGQRVLHTSERPTFTAKSRYAMPDSVLINPGQGYAALAPYLPTHRERA